MAQAASALSIALVAPHHWTLDRDDRELVDWVRSGIIDLSDEYFDISASQMRVSLLDKVREIEIVCDRLPSGADHDRLCDVRARIVAIGAALGRTTPDQLADRLMVAASLLVTGHDYHAPDAPALFM